MEQLRNHIDKIGQAKFASQLDVTQQAVNKWLRLGKVPPGRAPRVSKITGIPLRELNPVFAEVSDADQ